jgi:hypothetical protein
MGSGKNKYHQSKNAHKFTDLHCLMQNSITRRVTSFACVSLNRQAPKRRVATHAFGSLNQLARQRVVNPYRIQTINGRWTH